MKINTTLFLFIITLIYGTNGHSQILFENSVNNSTLGTYTRDQLIPEWKTTSGNGFSRRGEGEDRVTIVEYGVTGKREDRCLKVKYPAYTHDSKHNGAQWKTKLDGVYNELYMSYYVKFGKDFGLDKIGKLPGFGGGLVYNDGNRNTEWSGKLMWREGGRLQFYLNQPITSQNQFDWPRTFESQKERWYHIELHYKMNTPGVNNGIMEAWLDGEFISRYNNVPFRDDARVGITEMFFSTFYGGNEIHEPIKDNYAYFDDFKVSQSRIGFTELQTTLSLNNITNPAQTLKVYPNPSITGKVNILNTQELPLTIELLTVTGKTIHKQNSKGRVIKLNKPNLNSGLYVIKLETKGKTVYKKLLIK